MLIERFELKHAPHNILYSATADNFYYKQVFSKSVPVERREAYFEIQSQLAYEEQCLSWSDDD